MCVRVVYYLFAAFGEVLSGAVGVVHHTVPISSYNPFPLWGDVGEGANSTETGGRLGGGIERGIGECALGVFVCGCDSGVKSIV